MRLIILSCILIVLNGCGRHYTTHRSPLRRPSHQTPTLVVSDDCTRSSYARSSSHYKKHPIFTIFDYRFFLDHHVPAEGIPHPDGSCMVSKTTIDSLIYEIVTALKEGCPLEPYCTIIRDANFNYTTLCGLIMVKLNNYPLIVKLFRETPESFVSPFSKGFEPTTFFFMSGGSNRHIAGLTRIPNRYHLLSLIKADKKWLSIVRIPRKWYWSPQPIEWLYVDGYHLDAGSPLHTKIPALYAVIADYIDTPPETKLGIEAQKDIIMDLCCVCSLHLDPHMKNFIIGTQPESDIPTITIIDTEDHSVMTGITEPITYTNHLEWYAMLTKKFLKDLLFNIKQDYTES